MSSLLETVKKFEPPKEKKFLHTLYDGFFTFLFTPDHTTHGVGVHIRDRMDLKRTMVMVVLALSLCYIFGIYNTGHQHFVAIGEHTSFMSAMHLKLFHGLIKMLPVFIVTHVVGLGIEFYYAARKGHGIEEGFLVTGALIPLIMPPDIPLWILAFAVTFAVILGKEAFGGTGMNVVNIALLARAFVFFAYPGEISGDRCWVSGLEFDGAVASGEVYGWAHHLSDGLFKWLGVATFGEGGGAVVDGWSGATPLALAKGGWDNVTAHYSSLQMLWGSIPGSVGETCKPAILVGALILIATGIASWRIMLSMFLGAAFMGILFNWWGHDVQMDIPWYFHFYMGSFFFAMAFMATDPVTAASTNTGKWIYGFGIGMLGIIIRVMNAAYPEGWMLAILFMNVWAPLIDHFVVQSNMKRRAKRAVAA